MRILLINPLSGHFKFDAMSMPPLGILVVAAKLREEGHDVVFLDRNAILYGSLKCVGEPTPLLLSQVDRHVRQAMRQHQPQIVGITMMTCQMRDVRRISVLIRKMAGADTRIVLGGYHPTCEPSTVFRDIPEVDVIIRGQGEWAMAELAAGKPLLQIAGVSFRQRVAQPRIARLGDWVTGRIRPFDPSEIRHNLDSFWSKDRNLTVMPARDLIATDYYQREGDAIINYYYFHRPASIVTAQGCPKRCSFCASKLMESKLFFSPAQQMIEEVSHLVYDGGVTGLFFYDINFPVHRKRTEAFTTAMVEMGLADKVKWLACASADNLPYDLLPQMRRAGCVGLLFGFESASQRILDILNKDIDVNLHQKAVDACKANDIRPQSAFIVGVPGETECDFMANMEFIDHNDLMSGLNILLPLPATEINRRLVADGRLDPSAPDYWGMISDTNAPVTPERVYSDIPFDRFMDLFQQGQYEVCAKTWKTVYVDQPRVGPAAPVTPVLMDIGRD